MTSRFPFQRNLLSKLPIGLGLILSAALHQAGAATKVVDLRCEFQTNPEAVNHPLPRLSWRIESDERTWLQGGYHILAASSAERLAKNEGDIWDSGPTADTRSQFVPYNNAPFTRDRVVHWKVKVKNQKGQETPWSQPATFAIKLSGPPKLPDLLFADNVQRLSSFECSDSNLNNIYDRAAAEIASIRDLRDINLSFLAAGYHQFLNLRSQSWLHHLNNSIDAAGYYPAILPSDGSFGATRSEAGIGVTHAYWWITGDDSILDRYLTNMHNYVIARKLIDRGAKGQPFGTLPADTLPPGDPTPPEFVNLMSRAISLRLMLEIGGNSGKHPREMLSLQQLYQSLQEPFAKAHLDPDGSLKYPSITAHLLALRSGLLVNADHKKTIAANVAKLLPKNDSKSPILQSPTTAQALLPILSWTGQHDRAVALAKQLGASQPSPLSLACASQWLISMVAGIGAEQAGFQSLSLRPLIPSKEALSFAKAHYDTPYGRIETHWYYENDSLRYDVTIPPNTTALVHLPNSKGATITENGKPIQESPKSFINFQNAGGVTTFRTGSGSYQFKVGE